MRQKKIVIGTRGSNLSLIQTDIIKKLLSSLLPEYSIEIKIIKTLGDKNMKPIPLDSVGKGWFTKELDKALLDDRIDLAVHSLKDIPEALPKGLFISAIPERNDAREALVSRNGFPLEKLKNGAIIGTDSIRRKVQIEKMRPDIVVKSIRGNVNRRLEKLDNKEYDAICLAVAGLKRLGMSDRITQYFAEKDFIPSPGQGALAIVSKKNNKILNQQLSKLNDQKVVIETTAERIFSDLLGGGCSMPIGAFAKCRGEKITIIGMVASIDGKYVETQTIRGEIKNADSLAKKLANYFLKKQKYVVITRPVSDDNSLQEKLEKLGLPVFSLQSVMIKNNSQNKTVQKTLHDLKIFDWILFTSHNGVRYFMENVWTIPTGLIGVVGTATADEAKKFKLKVSFIPSKFTTENLGQELPNVKGKNILLPRSDIANPRLQTILEKRGAIVTNIPIYKTTYAKNNASKTISTDQILCLTFTSPSTIKGFLQNINDLQKTKNIFSIPVVSIGPVTTKAAKEHGFTKIYTAKTHTTEGLITKLQESVL